MAVDCYTTFDETCGDTTGSYTGATMPATDTSSSASADAQSWINTLGGLFGTIYKTVNPPSPGIVQAGRGIPGSPQSLSPVQKVGGGTILFIIAVLVFLYMCYVLVKPEKF